MIMLLVTRCGSQVVANLYVPCLRAHKTKSVPLAVLCATVKKIRYCFTTVLSSAIPILRRHLTLKSEICLPSHYYYYPRELVHLTSHKIFVEVSPVAVAYIVSKVMGTKTMLYVMMPFEMFPILPPIHGYRSCF